MLVHPLLIFQLFILYHVAFNVKAKTPRPYVQSKPAAKYDNPNFVLDRKKNRNDSKPQMPDAWNNRNRQPFHPAWMDYCAKYHCDDYHKMACGLNRKTMRFKWFQSQCHIILNNQCAYFRGLLKYDIVDSKFCFLYVMQVRSGCPQGCDEDVAPVCALDHRDQPVLFKNRCALEMANCGSFIEKYEEVFMSVCDYHVNEMKIR